MSIEQRLRALEANLRVDAITLHFEDGSEKRIPADCLPDAYIDLLAGRRTPELEAILQSTSDDSGSSMAALIKAIAASAARMKAKGAE